MGLVCLAWMSTAHEKHQLHAGRHLPTEYDAAIYLLSPVR